MIPPTMNMTTTQKFSFYFLGIFLLVVGFTQLTAPFILILFSVLALREVNGRLKKSYLTIIVYIMMVTTLLYAVFYAGREAIKSVPEVADKSIPIILEWTSEQGIELPFNDMDSFKTELVHSIQSETALVASSAEHATRQLVVMLLALVISAGIFLNSKLDLTESYTIKNNIYAASCNEIAERFGTLYKSFRTVMGAQLVISLINTALTSTYLFWVDLPHKFLLIVATFLCGLIPVVGNIISNTIIIGIAATISVTKVIESLIFLVILHKLEYFLNSKIIGERIKNPMWLTLSSLILGEYILGIPGIILAPVLLQYVKSELSRFKAY